MEQENRIIIIKLLKMKMRQGINIHFINSKIGWLSLILQFIFLIALFYYAVFQAQHIKNYELLLVYSAVILFSNCYSITDKTLYNSENKADLLLQIDASIIVLANFWQLFLGNMRVYTLFPILFIIFQGHYHLIFTLFLIPFIGTAFAVVCNILIKKYLYCIYNIFFYLAIIVYVIGILGAMRMFFEPSTKLSIDVIWISFILLTLVSILFYALLKKSLSLIWRKTFLESGIRRNTEYNYVRFKRLRKIFSSVYTVKDWVLWWRNPILYFRMLLYLGLITFCMFSPFFQPFISETFLIVAATMTWLICFGELLAIAWQNEGDCKVLLWLADKKSSYLIISKILLFVPLVILGGTLTTCLGLAYDIDNAVLIGFLTATFFLSLCIFSLTVSFPSFKQSKDTSDLMFEQIPSHISSIGSHILHFPCILILLLPFAWSFSLCVLISIICCFGLNKMLHHFYAYR